MGSRLRRVIVARVAVPRIRDRRGLPSLAARVHTVQAGSADDGEFDRRPGAVSRSPPGRIRRVAAGIAQGPPRLLEVSAAACCGAVSWGAARGRKEGRLLPAGAQVL